MHPKSESYFREYLKKIPNDQLLQFYNDVEWTPFPVLVIKEYQNRFKPKNKKEITQKLKAQVERAKVRHSQVSKKIKSKGKTIKKKTSILSSSKRNLELLEKLGDLKKKGIITTKEFQDKKKELLERI